MERLATGLAVIPGVVGRHSRRIEGDERAGMGSIQGLLERHERDLGTLVSDVRALLDLRDGVWVEVRGRAIPAERAS